MKLFNYQKIFGAFVDGYQLISIAENTSDRQEKKMLAEALELIEAAWVRRKAFLEKRAAEAGEDIDLTAEEAAFRPVLENGNYKIRLQFLADYMIRKIAAVQNNTSIHDKKECAELKEVFEDYGVQLIPEFKGLAFDFINWTAKPGQKPKLLVHAKDSAGEEVVIRFEAAGELCQKFLNAAMEFKVKPGQLFDLAVEAVDPAIERNKKLGKAVVDVGRFVNHNLVLTVGEKTHTGHPPKGTKFLQKPTLEYMEDLFRKVQAVTQPEDI
ncbi:hypothetical protein [Comamonas thiooxydans]|uniref:hypothetical protein n=1 Tax=Comamonas thiooxydans TaxID=363952 RepID=UPI000B417FBF|nr:hypothetical protein [Comamonas thiooxydans]